MTDAAEADPTEAGERLDIRLATAADADVDAIARLITQLGAELGGVPPEERPTADPGVLACTRRMLALRGSVYGLLAEREGKAAGVLMVNERAALRAADLYGKLTEIYVRPDLRRRGVAMALLGAAVALGRERGWSRLEIGAQATIDAATAKALLTAAGFRPCGPRLCMDL